MRWQLGVLVALSACTQVDRDPVEPGSAPRPVAAAPTVTTPAPVDPGGSCHGAPMGDDVPAARETFRMGMKLYDQGAYVDAAACFRTAYELQPRPELAYNIGHAYRKSGHHALARKFFERYLADRPDSPQAADVRKILADLPP